MAFGLIMEFTTKDDLHIRLAPLCRDDMPEFVEKIGMQSMQVGRFLGRSNAPVLEDEYDWYESVRAAKDAVTWGIFVCCQDVWKLIGTTGIGSIAANTAFRRGTTGFMIFNTEYWGKGIASHCHRARTKYAFEELGITCLYSQAYTANQGSVKALERIGYVCTGMNRNEGFHAGQFLHANHYELINPAEWAWGSWWQNDLPTEEWVQARARTAAALEWAAENVTYP